MGWDVMKLTWDLFENTGDMRYYLAYRALYGEGRSEEKERIEKEKRR